ncbi:unnamed protein product, partial [Iphiclides podalirius]
MIKHTVQCNGANTTMFPVPRYRPLSSMNQAHERWARRGDASVISIAFDIGVGGGRGGGKGVAGGKGGVGCSGLNKNNAFLEAPE